MTLRTAQRMGLRIEIEEWPRQTPVRITGYTWNTLRVLVATVAVGGCVGRGEAKGIYYRGDHPEGMREQIEALRGRIEAGISGAELQKLLPPGGARNALDCALWDLECKLAGLAAWELAGISEPRPLLTTFTCHAEAPKDMAARAASYRTAAAIKLKLTGEPQDAERVQAVREALPDVWLAVDANQGFTPELLEHLMPVLIDARVALIEQPFRVGEESLLDGLASPIPIAADESVQGLEDMQALRGRFNVVNIKLDKCGGITEALAMARAARDLGLVAMVGTMGGTSLAMAPAFVVGQLCAVVDLDGPVFLSRDRPQAVTYADGLISCPRSIWG